MVVRVSFGGKAPALDRVDKDDGGPGGVDLVVSVEQQSDVVSAEITYRQGTRMARPRTLPASRSLIACWKSARAYISGYEG